MFTKSQSPFARLAGDVEEKKSSKMSKGSETSKHDDKPHDRDDISKSVTVNQHHDGHYSVEHPETGETTHHDDLEEMKEHLGHVLEGGDEDHDGDEADEDHGSMSGMY